MLINDAVLGENFKGSGLRVKARQVFAYEMLPINVKSILSVAGVGQ